VNRKSRNLTLVLGSSQALVLLGALGASFATSDSRYLSRGGSVMAAIAAGAVFFQVRREIRIERQHEREHRRLPQAQDHATPLDRAAQRLREAKVKVADYGLLSERLVLVAWVSASAFLGELIHGLGDWLLQLAFPALFHG
jgi:hypothetical protein